VESYKKFAIEPFAQSMHGRQEWVSQELTKIQKKLMWVITLRKEKWKIALGSATMHCLGKLPFCKKCLQTIKSSSFKL